MNLASYLVDDTTGPGERPVAHNPGKHGRGRVQGKFHFLRSSLTYGTDERRCEVVLGEAEQDARLAHSRVPDEQQFEQIIVRLRHCIVFFFSRL